LGLFRFLLALCVVMGHAPQPTISLFSFNYMSATTAVEVFFAISGFYMQLVLREKYTVDRIGKNYITKFYCSRYTRLMPAYLVCLVATIIYLYVSRSAFAMAEYPNYPLPGLQKIYNLSDTLNNILFKCFFVFTSIFLFFQDLLLNIAVSSGQAQWTLHRTVSDFYIPSAMLLPQAWSLGVELSFYLLAPFLLKMQNWKLMSLFLLLITIKLYLILLGEPNDLYYRSLPFTFPYFLLGAIVYRYRDKLNIFKERSGSIRIFHAYAFIIMVSLLLPIQGLSYSVPLVIICALHLPSLFAATKNSKIDRLIGEMSYPIYIFHILFYMIIANSWRHFVWLRPVFGIDPPQLVVLVTIIFTVGVSAAFVWIELAFINPVRVRLFEK